MSFYRNQRPYILTFAPGRHVFVFCARDWEDWFLVARAYSKSGALLKEIQNPKGIGVVVSETVEVAWIVWSDYAATFWVNGEERHVPAKVQVYPLAFVPFQGQIFMIAADDQNYDWQYPTQKFFLVNDDGTCTQISIEESLASVGFSRHSLGLGLAYDDLWSYQPTVYRISGTDATIMKRYPWRELDDGTGHLIGLPKGAKAHIAVIWWE